MSGNTDADGNYDPFMGNMPEEDNTGEDWLGNFASGETFDTYYDQIHTSPPRNIPLPARPQQNHNYQSHNPFAQPRQLDQPYPSTPSRNNMAPAYQYPVPQNVSSSYPTTTSRDHHPHDPSLPNRRRLTTMTGGAHGVSMQPAVQMVGSQGSSNGGLIFAPRTARSPSMSNDANRIPVPTDIITPSWLIVNTERTQMQAFKPAYDAVAVQDWPSAQAMQIFRSTMVVRPHVPRLTEPGIPSTQTESNAIAHRLYEAIVDFRLFYGSAGGPVAGLLQGRYDRLHIMKRCIELLAEAVNYHRTGIEIPTFTDPNCESWSRTELRDSEQHDPFLTRVDNIEAALRFSKLVACDILGEKVNLAIFVLAPRRAVKAKISYAESNSHRAVKNKRRTTDEASSPGQN